MPQWEHKLCVTNRDKTQKLKSRQQASTSHVWPDGINGCRIDERDLSELPGKYDFSVLHDARLKSALTACVALRAWPHRHHTSTIKISTCRCCARCARSKTCNLFPPHVCTQDFVCCRQSRKEKVMREPVYPNGVSRKPEPHNADSFKALPRL